MWDSSLFFPTVKFMQQNNDFAYEHILMIREINSIEWVVQIVVSSWNSY